MPYSTPHLDALDKTRHQWWTYSPIRALNNAVTRLRIGHSRLNSHLHKLGMTENPHCLGEVCKGADTKTIPTIPTV